MVAQTHRALTVVDYWGSLRLVDGSERQVLCDRLSSCEGDLSPLHALAPRQPAYNGKYSSWYRIGWQGDAPASCAVSSWRVRV